VRSLRFRLIAVFLLGAFLASLAGVADVIEAAGPIEDCSEPCPGDSSDAKCPSSCEECTCCPRASSALLFPFVEPNTARRIESVAPAMPTLHPLALSQGVYHPPRA
jgi:hypothetical protein